MCTEVNAAFWIQYDSVTKLNPKCRIGDSVKLGAVASYETYNTPLIGWLRSNESECADVVGSHKKIDTSLFPGSRVIDWTTAELDAETAIKLQAQKDSETARIDAGEITLEELLDALISKGAINLTKKEINDEVKLKNAILNP